MNKDNCIFPTDMRLIVLRALYGDQAALREPVLFKPNPRKPEFIKIPFAYFMGKK